MTTAIYISKPDPLPVFTLDERSKEGYMKSSGTKGRYQKCKPITDRNIGKAHHHEKKGVARNIGNTQSGEVVRRQLQNYERQIKGSRRERQECKRLGITLEQLRTQNVSA